MFPRSLALVVALISVQGSAQLPIDEIAAAAGVDVAPENAEGFGVYLRPLDDSDVEMQQLAQSFFELTPCGDSPVGLCDEALALLSGGGNRLATYLIRQAERNDAEGFPNRVTYLRLLGYTESDEALRYLMTLVDAREQTWHESFQARLDFQTAIEALGRTGRPEVAERAVWILEAAGDDPDVQIRAVNAFDRVQAKHGPQAALAPRLRAVVARNTQAEGMNTASQRIERVLAAPGLMKP